ncbi:hypothetical protein DdX_15732 [Ditylenchus destructor]|uniref:Uncharacterized protein n=1 Tax=Ditylenchus destructor TaxID=166010 RepID=A0AAD4MQW6_9BILA|nr:hypothetical protein DdX_15732 [Ditylenchus destructor]
MAGESGNFANVAGKKELQHKKRKIVSNSTTYSEPKTVANYSERKDLWKLTAFKYLMTFQLCKDCKNNVFNDGDKIMVLEDGRTSQSMDIDNSTTSHLHKRWMLTCASYPC